jgi:hypothetical protein
MESASSPRRSGRWIVGVGMALVLVTGLAALGGSRVESGTLLGLLAAVLILSVPFGLLTLLLVRLVVGAGRRRPTAAAPVEGDRLCPDCGQGIESRWDACPHCGADVDEPEASETRV